MHVLRTVCRVRALSNYNRGRNDLDGIDYVDVEACSRKPWVAFRDSLSERQQMYLNIFRCGAVSTDTRHFSGREGRAFSRPECNQCRFCKALLPPSMRHLVTECAFFDDIRSAASETYRLTPRWWSSLPRVTSKSGWISLYADRNPLRRSVMQVAVCRVALAIIPALHREGLGKQSGQRGTSVQNCQTAIFEELCG